MVVWVMGPCGTHLGAVPVPSGTSGPRFPLNMGLPRQPVPSQRATPPPPTHTHTSFQVLYCSSSLLPSRFARWLTSSRASDGIEVSGYPLRTER